MVAEDNYKGKAELERFLDLMDISDDQLKIMNANEQLPYNDSRILNRTMTEEQYKKSWLYLDALGSEYHTLVQKGIAGNRKKKYKRQLDIEAEMVERFTPYVWKIARVMVYGNGWPINSARGYKVRLSLKDSEIPLEDLVPEGLAKIVDKISDYDPAKGTVNSYFRTIVAGEMYHQGRKYIGLLTLPQSVFDKARSIISKEDHRSTKKVLGAAARDLIFQDTVPKSLQAIAIYHGLNRRWVDIHNTASKGILDNSPSHDTFEGRYLEDESEEAKTEELAGYREFQQKTVALLETLTPIEQDILRQRIWEEKTLKEIGKKYHLGRERIRILEAQALSKLRQRVKHLMR